MRETENQFRLLFENSSMGIVLHRMVYGEDGRPVDYRIIEVNPQFSRILGIPAEEAVGRLASELYGTDSPPYLDIYAEVAQGGAPAQFDTYFKPMDRHFHINAYSPQKDTFVTVFADVTDAKQVEEELRESEERFRSIFEQAAVGICHVTAEGRFLRVNESLCRILGYEREKLVGMKFEGLPRAAVGNVRPVRLADLAESGTAHKEKCYLRPDGSQVWCDLSISQAGGDSGAEPYFIIIVQDISARKEAEEARRVSEEKFEKAFRSSPVWVAVTTVAEGRWLEVNDAFTEMSGYTREEAVGKTSLDLNFWLDPEKDRQRVVDLFRRQGYFRNLEMKMRFKDGRVHTMLWSVDPIEYDGRECWLNVLFDITEKTQLEEQLRQSQKMEAVGTLAGGIAHDFNNILGAITGFTELALDSLENGLPVEPDLRSLLEAAERAKELVRRILTFSRKMETQFQPLDLNQQVLQAVKMLERTIPKMIDIQVELDDTLPPIQGDPGQLEQVMLNLATNARDAMPDGGTLGIRTKAVYLDEEFCRLHPDCTPGSHAEIRVRDTGCGMAAEVLEQAFEPFFTTKASGKGTGLGLSTVFGIVKMHGGFLLGQSEPGQGTTFRMYLPIAEAQAEPHVEEATPAETDLRGNETVLIVDDEPTLRAISNKILAKRGYTLLEAASGEEALALFRERREEIDLILLDINMPGMGGHRCLAGLLEINPRARVIIVSGYSTGGTIADALRAGAADYLAKPFKKLELLRMVREVLDR